jgi:translation initiation factor 1 (eIF-1/SUI1)
MNTLQRRKKWNGGELLKEHEADVTDINQLINVAETTATRGKTVRNIQNIDTRKIIIQRQISNRRKELTILDELDSDSDSGDINLNIKRRKNIK